MRFGGGFAENSVRKKKTRKRDENWRHTPERNGVNANVWYSGMGLSARGSWSSLRYSYGIRTRRG